MSSMVRRRVRHASSTTTPSPTRTSQNGHNGGISMKFRHHQPCDSAPSNFTVFRFFMSVIIISTVVAVLIAWTDKGSIRSKALKAYPVPGSNSSENEYIGNWAEWRERVIFYEGEQWTASKNVSLFMVDPIVSVIHGEECFPQPEMQNGEASNCIPMERWQTSLYPTCNNVHEFDMERLGAHSNSHFAKRAGRNITQLAVWSNDTRREEPKYLDYTLKVIGRGWYRYTWLLTSSSENVVLKTLRLDREFHLEIYEAHRVDAIAMERLTKSPYVIDIYSHCGQTVLNEYASFGDDIHEFKEFTKLLRTMNGANVLKLKLEVAKMIALAVQHVHEIGGKVNNATVMHYDINPSNVVMTRGGVPKLNDFNVAHFFYWDPVKNERCPFVSRLTTPWWRAPEEMDAGNHMDEMADIYSLGNILHQLLVGFSPRGRSRKDREDEVRTQIRDGIPPAFPPGLVSSNEPGIVALVKTINGCYQPNPRDRMGARTIVSILQQVIEESYKETNDARDSGDISNLDGV